MDKSIDNIWNIFHSPRFKSWAIGNLITKTIDGFLWTIDS